jgi:hypothetical protein
VAVVFHLVLIDNNLMHGKENTGKKELKILDRRQFV